MINVKNKRCEEENCETRPTFNYKGEKEGKYCYKHKKEGMIDVKNKKCEEEDCETLPTFNYKGEKEGKYCYEHKKEGMINVRSKKCEEEDCETKPTFNYKGEKEGKYCYKHKKENMIDVIHKRCEEEDCEKLPVFNYKGEKEGKYCVAHKKEGMIDVKNKLCKSCNLIQVLKKNNYLCSSYCNPVKTKRVKTKENEVKKLLELNNIQFIHNKELSNECCYKYRPDFVIDCLYYYLIVEVDEDAHKSYDKECELIRMNNLQLSSELPTKFIRYNPDKKGIEKNIKEKELIETVKEWMKKDIKELKTEEPVYLFY